MTAPRIGLYQCAKYDGAPFVRPDGTLDEQAIADTARFGVVILEAYVCLQRPELVAALRAANPALRLIAFVDLEKVHATPRTMDAETDLRYECYAALASVPLWEARDLRYNGYAALASEGRGILWSAKDGWPFDPEHLPGARTPWSNYAFNLACPEAVAALADVLIRRVVTAGVFDGVFFDLAQTDITWTQRGADVRDVIDLPRAGFASLTDFAAAYLNGHRGVFRALHDAAPDGFSITFNCSTTDPIESAWVNGQMDEGFPLRGDWLGVMKGIWTREGRRPADAENWINVCDPADIPFGLASACLADSARFTCTLTNGRPEPDGREKIWSPLYDFVAGLGEPLGPARLVAGRTWLREFERGAVVVDPARRSGRFYGSAP